MEDLRQQIAATRQALLDEEILSSYFVEVESLEDDSNPGFVEGAVNIYFQQCETTLNTIEQELQKPISEINFAELNQLFHLLKGSTLSIGAKKVNDEVMKTKELCKQAKLEECKESFEQLKNEQSVFKTRVTAYFELLAELKGEA